MKLLQKTIRYYFIYSIIILLIAVPVFYLVVMAIVKEDVDEDLIASKEMLKSKITNILTPPVTGELNFLDPDITLIKAESLRLSDTLFITEIYDSISGELVPHRVLSSGFLINNRPYTLQIKTSLVDKNNLILSIALVQAILLLLLLAGLFLINRDLSKRIWKPFYTALNKLRKYKVETHEPLALAKSSVNEFDDLNISLEELTERTHQTYLSQKEFTENASHEMQTPLAVFQSKLELLMQTSPLSEEQAQLMSDLDDASQRMIRLNRSLVLLTKIENNQFTEKEIVSLKRVIEDFIQQYQLQITQKQLRIENKLNTEVSLEANKVLIEILVSNLLRNAIRHNYINGYISIQLQEDILILQNTGKTSALDEHKLFRRFQKDSTDTNSIGLGLEIVKKICTLYGFTLTYRHRDGLHSFIIHFIKI